MDLRTCWVLGATGQMGHTLPAVRPPYLDPTMTLHHSRSNALCLAVAIALASAPATAEPYKLVFENVDLEEVPWATRYHIEIYDSRVHSTRDGDDAAVTASQGSLIMERTVVSTRGRGMDGVHVNGPVDSSILDSTITTYGVDAVGIEAGARGFLPGGGVKPEGTVTVRGTAVTTFGDRSTGVSHAMGGALVLDRSTIRTHGRESFGVWAYGSSVALTSTQITTTGVDASGIQARSTWLGGTSGKTAYNADVDLVGVHIDARGQDSAGIHALYQGGLPQGIGASIRLRDSRVRSAQSHAVKFEGGEDNRLSLSEGSVLDAGDAVLYADRAGTVSRVDATDSTLIGRGEQALVADNGAVLRLSLDNSDVFVEPGKGLAWAANGGQVDLQAKGSRLQGSAFADDVSRLDVALDATRWDAWGTSQVDTLTLSNGSTLLFGAGSVGDQFVVRGDFAIHGSTLVFDSALDDDRAPTDRLWVQGDTAGHGSVVVNNVGGRGAPTVNGIQLIQVDGVSGADFTLDGRAVGGMYEYFLYRGSKDDPADGGWYLRSELDPCSVEGACELPPPRPVPCSLDAGQGHCEPQVVVPPPPPALCGVDAGQLHCTPALVLPPPRPVLRPEAGTYLANQSAATGMFGMTQQDRSGSDRASSGQRAWARVARHQADYGVIRDQLGVSGDTDVLQVGTDVIAWGPGSRGQLGVMLGRGRANTTVTSRLTGYSARGKVDGQALGAYATWIQNSSVSTGLYLDAWANHASFKNSVQGDALSRERYDSKTTRVSLEAGYGIHVADGERVALFVEPQLQLSYTRFSADGHVETNGTVIDRNHGGGFGSRVGVRVSGHASTPAGNRVQPFLGINWIHEAGDNGFRFDGERLAGGLPRDRYELSGGAEVQLSQRWSGRGNLGWQRGDGYREVMGQLALRARW